MIVKETTEKRLGHLCCRIEEVLQEVMRGDTPLFEAARYSLFAGGKRLRPLLAIATAEAFGVDGERAIKVASALELVHTYSLIHDDLPCMDDDDLRRGKPTLHKVYPEAYAVLAGDFLLTYAFELIADAADLEERQRTALIATLAKNAGAYGMIGGQIEDIEAEGKEITENALLEIHKKKTAAMIAASLEFGGIIADLPLETLQTLRVIGQKAGLAFQLIDDLLDVTIPESRLGKTAASDIANHKATAVTTLGHEKTKNEAKRLAREAKEALTHLLPHENLLILLIDRLVEREY